MASLEMKVMVGEHIRHARDGTDEQKVQAARAFCIFALFNPGTVMP